MFKMQFAKYFFNKIYDSEGASLYIKWVSDSLHELFIYYGGIVLSSSNETVMSSIDENNFDVEFDRWKAEIEAVETFPNSWNTLVHFHQLQKAIFAGSALCLYDCQDSVIFWLSRLKFSVGGRVLDTQRASMLPDALEALIVGGDWLPLRKK
ncbi:hypothetical protein RD792_005875, partial [Penstemon davidsonii]